MFQIVKKEEKPKQNLNLNFEAPTLTENQFSTTNVNYSGGLAGIIRDSVIINVNINSCSVNINYCLYLV